VLSLKPFKDNVLRMLIMELLGKISHCSMPARVCSDSYPSMQPSAAASRLVWELALNIPFFRTLRPALPAALCPEEWVISFLTLVEHGLCRRPQTWHISKDRLEETGYANVQASQLLLQHVVYVFTVLGRIREAARIDGQGCLLEGRGRAGRRRRFGDGIVDCIPGEFVRLMFEDRVEQRSYSFDVEIVRTDYAMKPREVVEEAFTHIPGI